MKINTHKLLLLLFSDQDLKIHYQHLESLWPELSPPGRRSLISHLVRKRLLEPVMEMSDSKKVHFHLTEFGRSEARRVFGGILLVSQPEPEKRYCLVLLEEAEHDPNFISLKKRLRQFKAVQVSSKTFFLASQPSQELVQLLQQNYFYQTALFQVGEWLVGELKQLLQQNASSKDVIYALSGISRELDRLIDGESTYLVANHQSFLDIFSAYHRFFSVLIAFRFLSTSDNQLSSSSREVLSRFQTFLFSE